MASRLPGSYYALKAFCLAGKEGEEDDDVAQAVDALQVQHVQSVLTGNSQLRNAV